MKVLQNVLRNAGNLPTLKLKCFCTISSFRFTGEVRIIHMCFYYQASLLAEAEICKRYSVELRKQSPHNSFLKEQIYGILFKFILYVSIRNCASSHSTNLVALVDLFFCNKTAIKNYEFWRGEIGTVRCKCP